MKRRFFSGPTLDKAVLLAASHYGIDPSEVSYKEREKQGMLRARRGVVIEVDPENPRVDAGAGAPESAQPAPEPTAAEPVRKEPEPAPEPKPADEVERAEEIGPADEPTPVVEHKAEQESVAEAEGDRFGPARDDEPPAQVRAEEPAREPAPREGHSPSESAEPEADIVGLPEAPRPPSERHPPATGTTAFAVEKALRLALDFVQVEAEIAVRQGDNRLEVELDGPDNERILADDGRLLLTLQHLIPRMVRGFIGESVACRVDCDNFHLIREETLRDMAQRAANEVRRRGRPWTLKAMPPEERRIVHITLVDDPAVKTESVGDGFFKRVRIRPV